jgi:hypothetical protein
VSYFLKTDHLHFFVLALKPNGQDINKTPAEIFILQEFEQRAMPGDSTGLLYSHQQYRS